ncbi:hypothetical protein ACFLZJ_01315 [Nanoarchaeota archaeon]
MEKFLENLAEAEKTIKTTDHLIYMTFPLVKDKRLLLQIISEIKKGLAYCINAILQYEYLFKRIKLHKDPKENFKTFMDKCAPRYNITSEEVKTVVEIFGLIDRHKESPMAFTRGEDVVILSEDLGTETVSPEKVKEFLQVSKNILKKIKQGIGKNSGKV